MSNKNIKVALKSFREKNKNNMDEIACCSIYLPLYVSLCVPLSPEHNREIRLAIAEEQDVNFMKEVDKKINDD